MAAEDGTVQWDAAKEFFTGKAKAAEDTEAGDTQDATDDKIDTQETQLVDVRIKGRTIKMAAEDAAAFEEFRREVRERDGRLGGEISQYKERLAKLEGKMEVLDRVPATRRTELTPPPASLAHENFEEWDRQNRAFHAAKMAQLAEELEEKYRQDKEESTKLTEEQRRTKSWADGFFSTYDHLSKPRLRTIVGDVYGQHADEINSAGSVKAQHERLAELVDEALLDIKGAGKEAQNRKPPRLEGGSTPTPRRKSDTSDERKPLTGEEWMKAKRAAMRGEVKK